ncbi:MAG: pilus assembly protein PilM [Firmicutes bacterium]|nr:pilus assembly protein PilM [Candidatus Caballimonas caccae]
MQKKQVAIIDIGSSKISALIGEKGINGTFVIKYNAEYEYDGFEINEFFDKEGFLSIIKKVGKEIKEMYHGILTTVFVGVPGAFTESFVRDSQVSFSKKKKITDEDLNALFDNAYSEKLVSSVLINRSAILYELDDFRRVANPVGEYSEILKAKLSFIICTDYFTKDVEETLNSCGIRNVEFVSSPLAEALYLVEPDVRDRYAVVLDVGYITTTLSIIQGDGIVFMKSFDFGGGYITANLVENFELSFDEAEKIKRKINLLSKSNYVDSMSVLECENGKYLSLQEVSKSILICLDTLCENISNAFFEYKNNLPEYVSLMITGGGISYLRGAKEHIAGRLNMVAQIIAPNVPLMEKPTMSSILSLLNIALEQN